MRDERWGMMAMSDRGRPHEKLQVYRMAHAFGLRVHAMSLKLPKMDLCEEGSQVPKSVSSQIVEGHALRQYKPEYVHYLSRAYASSEETIEHLKYLLETGSAKEVAQECTALLEEYAVLCRKPIQLHAVSTGKARPKLEQ